MTRKISFNIIKFQPLQHQENYHLPLWVFYLISNKWNTRPLRQLQRKTTDML